MSNKQNYHRRPQQQAIKNQSKMQATKPPYRPQPKKQPEQEQQQPEQPQPVFANGFRVFTPHPNAPEWVIADIILNVNDLTEWIAENGEYIHDRGYGNELRLSIKQSQKGVMYAQVNTYRKL